VLGEGFTNLFDYLKQQALSLQKSLVKWTIKGPELDKEVVDAFSAMGQAIIEIIEGTKTWLKSLSGLLPILGLVYQTLRLIFTILNPIVEFFGTIITLVGYLASGLSEVLKAINDFLSHSKALQVLVAAVVAMIVGPLLGALFPVLATTASWVALLVGALAVVGLIVKSMEYIGKGFAFLIKSASETDWLKNAGASIEGTGAYDVEKATNEVLVQQAKFKQNIIKLDEKQTDALLKLTQLTGEISEEDRRRMTTLNDITGLYQDQYK
jgi:hypothetical protein